MPVKTYPQLDGQAMALLQARCDALGKKALVAKELGVSRSAVSSALSGRYPADVRKLRSRIVETYADQVHCPHLDRGLAPAACKSMRERDMEACMGSREDVKQWQACQGCQHNPTRKVAP